jgi:hypothetical protein
MMETFFGGVAAWFTVPAVLGTLYFAIQMVFQGMGADTDLDADFNPDIPHDTVGHEMKIISLQTLSAFCMGAGWIGLASYRLLDLSPGMSSLVALIAGAAVGWMLVALLRAMLRLQNSGNIELTDTVGLTGEVYIEIPESGRGSGRVKLVVREHMREFHAVQAGEVAIPTGAQVRIAGSNPGSNTLTVERA